MKFHFCAVSCQVCEADFETKGCVKINKIFPVFIIHHALQGFICINGFQGFEDFGACGPPQRFNEIFQYFSVLTLLHTFFSTSETGKR